MSHPAGEVQEPALGGFEDSVSLDERSLAPRTIEVSPDLAAVLSLPAVPTQAETKTMTFQPRTISGGGDVFAELIDRTVTVTRMHYPASGLPFLVITFAHKVSSLGWRTGRGGPTGEAAGAVQGIQFKNQAGGVMWNWGNMVNLDFDCGWHYHEVFYHRDESNYVDWFDLWERSTYQVNGVFYPCG